MKPINIQAAVCRKQGELLGIEQLQLSPPDDDEVRVKIDACSICHSDITQIKGNWVSSGKPFVVGHEAAGTVIDKGKNVDKIAVNDSVVVTLIRSCGHCPACKEQHPVCCDALDSSPSPLSTMDGEVIEQGFRTAAFATHCVVHHSQVVAIPHTIPKASAALLGCSVLTGHGAVVNVADIPKGANVAIVGTGGLGLNAIQAAVQRNAKKIIAIDIIDAKLTTAKQLGATAVINSRRQDPVKAVLQLCESGLDYVFVTAGNREMFSKSLEMIHKYGTSVIVGMPADDDKVFSIDSHSLTTGRKLLGCKMGDTIIDRDIPMLIEQYQNGSLKLDELITHCYPLEQINIAIDEVVAGNALRNIIRF